MVQKKSGSTYTLLGDSIEWKQESDSEGILPRIVRAIFDYIMDQEDHLEFNIKISCIAADGKGKLFDLMTEGGEGLNIKLNDDSSLSIIGLIEEYVSGDEELFDIVAECLDLKKQGHSFVFTMTIVSKNNQKSDESFTSRITLIDLDSSMVDFIKKLAYGIKGKGDQYVPSKDNGFENLLYYYCFSNSGTRMILNCSSSMKDASGTINLFNDFVQFGQFKVLSHINLMTEKTSSVQKAKSEGVGDSEYQKKYESLNDEYLKLSEKK